MIKNSIYGFLLALQFFTVLPIKKSFPMNRQSITAMYCSMPFIGLLMGMILASVYVSLAQTSISEVLLAIVLIVVHIAMTGGLHLDGYVDVSDAYFSYGEKEKRLQILEDPRIGAFGAISLGVLFLVRFGVGYEVVLRMTEQLVVLFIAIPVLARLGVMALFLTMKTAKNSGLAYYFTQHVSRKGLTMMLFVWIVALLVSAFVWPIVFYCVVAAVLFVWLFRSFCYRHFGGMTGDTLGAFYEGSYVLLWIVALLCILFGMS